MKYIGSKRRIGSEILTKINPRKYWVEPFGGGLNMTAHVCNLQNNLFPIAEEVWVNEKNEYIVALIKAYKDGWTIYDFEHPEIYEHPDPKYGNIKGDRISKILYRDVKQNPHKYPPEVVGFVGCFCSYRSIWYDTSYAIIDENTPENIECNRIGNFTLLGHRSITATVSKIEYDRFTAGCYSQMELPPPNETNIYCDPPYKNTVKYASEFDYEQFYAWCIEKHNQGYKVYISEYEMPEPFVCIWEKKIDVFIDHNTSRQPRIEKLFTLLKNFTTLKS